MVVKWSSVHYEKNQNNVSASFFSFFDKAMLATVKSLYEKSCGLRKSRTDRSMYSHPSVALSDSFVSC